MEFQIGNTYMTRGINEAAAEDSVFAQEVWQSLQRYMLGDWGDMCEADKQSNDEAVETGERILAAYETSRGKIWIITEADRSGTVILFPDEY